MPVFPSSQGAVDGAPTPMPWLTSAIDPAVSFILPGNDPSRPCTDRLPQAQGFSSDFSMETLGFSLNDLWGEAWELG